MTEWRIELAGEDLDLSTVASLLPGPELNVIKSDDQYYLRGSDLELYTSADDIHAYAEAILPIINGASRMSNSDAQPLAIGAIYKVHDDGRHDVSVPITRALNVRSRVLVTAAVNEAPPSPPPGSTLMERVQIAQRRPEVDLALRFFGASLNWFNLYKVCEIIEEDMGDSKQLESKGWVTKAQLAHFTGSANSYNSTGADARHALRKPRPMKQPAMTLSEAQVFIRSLLDNWIRLK